MEEILKEALKWYQRQGQFLQPKEGDDWAWDEYMAEPIPAWVTKGNTLINSREQ